MKLNIYLIILIAFCFAGCIDQNPAPIEYGTSRSSQRSYYPIESDDAEPESKIISTELTSEDAIDTRGINDPIYKNTPTLDEQKRTGNPPRYQSTPVDYETKHAGTKTENNSASLQPEDDLASSIDKELKVTKNQNKSSSVAPQKKTVTMDQNESKADIGSISDSVKAESETASDNTAQTQVQSTGLKISKPVAGTVINKFGDIVEGKRLNGVDVKSEKNHTQVFSLSSGIVVFADMDEQFGNLVIIKSDNEMFYAYAKLKSIYVKRDDNIARNTVIGEISPNGVLHVAVRKKDRAIDPTPYLK